MHIPAAVFVGEGGAGNEITLYVLFHICVFQTQLYVMKVALCCNKVHITLFYIYSHIHILCKCWCRAVKRTLLVVGAVWYSVEITKFRDSPVELVKKSFGPPGPQLSPASNGDFAPVRLSELLPHTLFKGYRVRGKRENKSLPQRISL